MRHQRALYNQYAPPMMGLCMRYASSEAEAEDILQEGFVSVFSKIESFQGTGELGAWIRKIILNAALMNYRKNKKHQQQMDLAEVGFVVIWEGLESSWKMQGCQRRQKVAISRGNQPC